MHALQVTEIEAARERLMELKRQVSRVYIGDASAIDLLTVALLSRGHVLPATLPSIWRATAKPCFRA